MCWYTTAKKRWRTANVSENAKEIACIEHPYISVLDSILKDSNNKNTETLTKIASREKYNEKASLKTQIQLIYDYWKDMKVDTTNIIFADSSGVSRNNLVTVNFMTDALNKLYKENPDKMKERLAQPGEGTLSNRLLNQRGNMYLKTGTLSNISGVTGYVINTKGKVYSVAILIENFVYTPKDIKLFENQLLETIQKM